MVLTFHLLTSHTLMNRRHGCSGSCCGWFRCFRCHHCPPMVGYYQPDPAAPPHLVPSARQTRSNSRLRSCCPRTKKTQLLARQHHCWHWGRLGRSWAHPDPPAGFCTMRIRRMSGTKSDLSTGKRELPADPEVQNCGSGVNGLPPKMKQNTTQVINC